MVSVRPWLVPFAICGSLVAQGPPVLRGGHEVIVRLAVDEVPTLLAHLPQAAVGRLLADPEVAEAFETGLQAFRRRHAGSLEVLEAAEQLGLLQSDALSQHWLRQIDVRDLQAAELLAVGRGEDGFPGTVFLLAPVPKAEGRATRMFEDLAARMARVAGIARVDDGRFDGMAAHVFTPAAKDEEVGYVFGPQGFWLAHVPGAFVGGDGEPLAGASVGRASARPRAAATVQVRLRAYIDAVLARMGGAVPPEVAALGLDVVDTLTLRLGFAGERILTEGEVVLSGPPTGLVAALLAGNAPLPPQPLPAGALVQCRCALDVAALLGVLTDSALMDGMTLPAALVEGIEAAFSGGMAMGIAAPAPGGVVPRMFLSLSIGDETALDGLLDRLVEQAGLERKTVTYEGVECTVLKNEAMPAVFQPTLCRRGGVLHVAESGLSMRALLKAIAAGGEAMDVGEAPVPEGPGEILPTFDLRADEAAIYRAFFDLWLPLYELSPGFGLGGPPLVRRADMPAPDTVARFCGGTRGVLRRTADGYLLQELGALGGALTSALAMTWGPILTQPFHGNSAVDDLRDAIARRRLEAAFPVLDAWRKEHGSLPATLGELFAAGKLVDDALLVPGDAQAEDVPVPGTDRKVRSSFRWYPNGVDVDDKSVILIAIAPRPYRRPMLTGDGELADIWGEHSRQPIDRFGK